MIEGSILQKLESAHRGGPRPLNLGVYYKNTLVSLCHALEDFILDARSQPLVISAFQQGKWYLQEADRYGKIAERSRQIAIMAAPNAGFREHPTGQRDNVHLLDLKPSDPVAQEWHLVILAPTYTAMVLCQELSDADYGETGRPDADLERKFYGFWTFEPDLVLETVDLAIAHVAQYDTDLSALLQRERAAIATDLGREREDAGVVVSQVVEYLRQNQDATSTRLREDARDSYLPQLQKLDENLVSNEMQAFLRMAQLIDAADANNPNAAAEVATLAEAMAQLLDVPAWQQTRLRLASLLHRLAPTGLGIAAVQRTVPEHTPAPHCDLVPSVQSLRAMPPMGAIARIVTHQTECWDGGGGPGGLGYDAIPLESRVLKVAAFFQHRVNELRMQANGDPSDRQRVLAHVLAECKEQANTQFDPKLVEALEVLVLGMQQGMSLHAPQPKIAAGMWLLDGRTTAAAVESTVH
ncbi:putative sensor protein [Rubidibacter lacunae KORDI 51-2]|uniref:Putative sensor protein n=1 Tax=Rubidibacter lacunae KORDI 51-2 TaxID=582515 RepID=U5DJT5_9CHRO|nr:DICT sensory domain-containing protein [Rubidibacter lacunae]ERN41162.1 putative sensor protein [Rubidibacter lacunae KORDI 51-2]